jgi:hypothetical protein
MLTLAKLTVLTAVVASVILFARRREPFAIAALAASAVEALLAFGVIKLHIAGLNLGLVLGAVLAVGAIGAWLRTSDKTAVTAASIAGLLGTLQVLGALV